MKQENLELSFNFKGLPCIYENGKYNLFDPFTLKQVQFEDKEILNSPETIKKLVDYGFIFYDKMPDYTQPKNEKHLTFILTTDCNIGCLYCYTESKRAKIKMNPTLALEIIDAEIPDNYEGHLFVQFFGGEPTLNFSAIQAITKRIKEKCKSPFFYITTNGIMSDQVFDFLLQNHFGFYLSLDGTKEFNDINRITLNGKGTYDRVFETLTKVLSNNLPLKVRATITPATVDNMHIFAEEMFKTGVKLLHFTSIANVGYATDHNFLEANEAFQDKYVSNLSLSLDIAKKYNARILTPISLSLKRVPKPYCKIFHDDTKILITPEGKRTLCYGVQADYNTNSDKFLYADFDRDTKKFSCKSNVRTEILDAYEQVTTKDCNNCFAQFMCNGGCFAENLSSEGQMDKLDKNFCNMKRKQTYMLLNRITSNQDV